jgi:hypothetical protein
MIRVEERDREWARSEVEGIASEPSLTTHVWGVWTGTKLAMVVGLRRATLLGSNEIWIVPREGLREWRVIRVLKVMVGEARRRYGPLFAWVKPGVDARFAEIAGLTITQSVAVGGEIWLKYEVD